MHILITIITALAGLVWALYRLQNSGVNLNAFNPFYWMRRRAWAKQVNTKPYHTFDRPLDAAALFIVGLAKAEGDMSRELKNQVLTIFTETFKLNDNDAAALLGANSHYLQDIESLAREVPKILAPVLVEFSDAQKESTLALLNQIATAEGAANETQRAVIAAVEQQFQASNKQKAW